MKHLLASKFNYLTFGTVGGHATNSAMPPHSTSTGFNKQKKQCSIFRTKKTFNKIKVPGLRQSRET